MAKITPLLRSLVTTFVTSFIALVPLSAVVSHDFSWVQSAAVSAALAAIRTLVAYIDPGNTSFGIGSDTVNTSTSDADAPISGN